jgi:3-deoxy-D-manno-octulosonate 8-phosphate phosphatase (KDO 8-P phosphatase)
MDETVLATRLDPEELARRAQALRWLLLDVDGVLTDGRLYFGADGSVTKAFHAKDGLGVHLAQRAGLKVGSLSARADAAFAHRAAELGFDRVLAGKREKAEAFESFLAEEGLEPHEVAYAGDDLPDLPVLLRAGLSFAPADAARAVRAAVDVVLTHGGGQGAVRDLVELVLALREG